MMKDETRYELVVHVTPYPCLTLISLVKDEAKYTAQWDAGSNSVNKIFEPKCESLVTEVHAVTLTHPRLLRILMLHCEA